MLLGFAYSARRWRLRSTAVDPAEESGDPPVQGPEHGL